MLISILIISAAAAPVQRESETWKLGEARTFSKLQIIPITSDRADGERRYTTLDEAMAAKKIVIEETGSGEVPKLQLKNSGDDRVFVLTGEMLKGAKQDRISAHDVVIAPHLAKVDLGVYCVEAGRWQGSSMRFGPAQLAATKSVRRSAATKESQGVIWERVAGKSAAAHVRSSTGTLNAVMDNAQVRESSDAYIKALHSLASATPDMIGFVAIIDGEVSSADVFSNRPLFLSLWPKLLKAAAIDAVTPDGNAKKGMTAETFIDAGMKEKWTAIGGLGGNEYKIEGDVGGSALVDGERLVHLALFSK